jgi:hypothetical protein
MKPFTKAVILEKLAILGLRCPERTMGLGARISRPSEPGEEARRDRARA